MVKLKFSHNIFTLHCAPASSQFDKNRKIRKVVAQFGKSFTLHNFAERHHWYLCSVHRGPNIDSIDSQTRLITSFEKKVKTKWMNWMYMLYSFFNHFQFKVFMAFPEHMFPFQFLISQYIDVVRFSLSSSKKVSRSLQTRLKLIRSTTTTTRPSHKTILRLWINAGLPSSRLAHSATPFSSPRFFPFAAALHSRRMSNVVRVNKILSKFYCWNTFISPQQQFLLFFFSKHESQRYNIFFISFSLRYETAKTD